MNNRTRIGMARDAVRSSGARGVVVGTCDGTVCVSAEGGNTAPMFAALRAAGIDFESDGEGDYSTGEGTWVQSAYLR